MYVINIDMASVYNGYVSYAYSDIESANLIQIFDICATREKPKTIPFVREDDIFQFEFLDIDHSDSGDLYPDFALSLGDSEKIVEIIRNTVADRKSLIVQCFAGVSRSGAISKFANEKFGLIRRNQHGKEFNKHVYKLLNRVYKNV